MTSCVLFFDTHLKLFQPSYDQIRVLHVDDNELQRIMLRKLLRMFDSHIELDSLENPMDVLDELNTNWYDCLVTDYQMPEMTGIELTELVRKESNIPIILYTGKGSEEVAEKAFSVGVNDYFRKESPTQHYQVLAKRIREVVDKQRMEQIYTKVVKESSDAFAIIVKEKIVFANTSFAKLIGASSNQSVLGTNVLNLVTKSEIKRLNDDYLSLIKGNKSNVIVDVDIRKKNRKRVSVEVNACVIDYLGQKAFLCSFRDLTSRKLLEYEIHKSEERYRTLLELAPDGVMTVAVNGNITWVNKGYTKITGYTKEDVLGKKAWTINAIRRQDIKMFFGLFIELVRGKDVHPIEFQWISKDGKAGWGEARASILKVKNKTSEIMIILRDITDRKQMRDDLKKYSSEMKQLAEDRKRKLLDSEKMMAVGAIASTVAHDLRGPLSVVRNAIFMMDRQPERTPQLKQLIIEAVDRSVEMLNDIRVKTAEEVLRIEEMEIATFIESVIKETLIPSRITVKTDLMETVVSFDRHRLRRVLENLIRNAVDAMPNQGQINIRNYLDNDQVLIEISDTGLGISDDVLRGLFKPFKTTKATGTGLGLYYCRKTIEDHGGSIEVHSEVNVGTTFTLTIPKNRILDHGQISDTSVEMNYPNLQTENSGAP